MKSLKGFTLIELIICIAIVSIIAAIAVGSLSGCDQQRTVAPKSASGVSKASVQVQTGSDGLTIEQRNVRDRLLEDNKPGSIKHLYVISAYSGQVILYSTVRGKVTSSGKRLTPVHVTAYGTGQGGRQSGIGVDLGGYRYETNEVLQDDGTYGSSVEYLFWFDARGVYHQHYVTGGQIPHVSSEPLAVKSVIINIEAVAEDK